MYRTETKLYIPDAPKLSGEPNTTFSNAVNTLDVKVSPEMGRHVVCKGNIKTGDTLVVEAPYVASLIPDAFGSCCQHCFKRFFFNTN